MTAGGQPVRPEIRVAHTGQLPAAALADARALLYAAFGDELEESDWEHALGGMHALAWEEGELVGHASVVQRRLLHRERPLRTGYVEGVAVRHDRRRRGIASALMDRLEPIVRAAYDLGALGASDMGAGLYAARGWALWRGPTSALTPKGIVRTAADDGSVYVLEGSVALDLDAPLICDWREGELW